MIDCRRHTQRHLAWLGMAMCIGLSGGRVLVQAAVPGTSLREEPGIVWDRALDGARQININEADGAALERLPGIGPSLARRIIAHRVADGPFRTTEELRRVSGIGSGIYDQVKDYVTVE